AQVHRQGVTQGSGRDPVQAGRGQKPTNETEAVEKYGQKQQVTQYAVGKNGDARHVGLLVTNLTRSHGESGHEFVHGADVPIFPLPHPYFLSESISPRARAAVAASWRVAASSRAMIAETWCSAVLAEMHSRRAISPLLMPSATSPKTSTC